MLRKSSLAYIITLWLLFQLLVEINCQITSSFKPRQRYGHTATLINDRLYILGGYAIDKSNTAGKDFFYLDVSVTFNTAQNLLWQDLTSANIVPSHAFAASAKGGVNNNTLLLYGGFSLAAEMESVYTFDPQSNSWSTPTITGIRDASFRGIANGIINYQGKMYLWSGLNNVGKNVNNMLILDTVQLNWGNGSLINAPIPEQDYGAVLLPNNNIIYIGGYNADNNIDLALDKIYIYDTINDKWSTQATTGTVPSARNGLSAVLGLDGQRIIIFGGTTTTNDDFTPNDSLYVLNLINFEWSIPKISGTVPNSRKYHKANVIEKYMVISFGLGYDQSTESDILLLDISNNEEYIWTNWFNNSESTLEIDKSLNNKKLNTRTCVIIIGSLFSVTSLSLGIFFLYRWNKNRQNQDEMTIIMPEDEDFKQVQVDNSFPVPVVSIGKTRFSIANYERRSNLYKN